jgi:hypothetical protein
MNRKSVFRRFISKFFPRQEKLEDGRYITVRRFKNAQLVGALIRTSKTTMYRVVGIMEDDFTQEVIKLKIR